MLERNHDLIKELFIASFSVTDKQIQNSLFIVLPKKVSSVQRSPLNTDTFVRALLSGVEIIVRIKRGFA